MKDLFEEYKTLENIADDLEIQGKTIESAIKKLGSTQKATALLDKQISFYLQGIAEVNENLIF